VSVDERGVVLIDACGVRMVDAAKVAMVRAALPPEEAVEELADVLGLLGDPTRLRLLLAMSEAGEMCVCDLAASTGIAESTVSHALRLLRAHRVVQVRRAARMAYYRLADANVRLLVETAVAHGGHTSAVHVERGELEP